MQYILLTFLVGGVGASIGMKLKIPAGAMMGAMVAVVIFNVFTGYAYMPTDIRRVTQIAAGALIGSRIRWKDIYDLKKIIVPALVLIIGLVVLNFSFGFLISRFTNLELSTALFAAAPGGLSDMALIADELGADSPKVAILQMIRVVSILSFFPVSIKFACKLIESKKVLPERVPAGNASLKPGDDSQSVEEMNEVNEMENDIISDVKSGKELTAEKAGKKLQNRKNLFLTICSAAAGGTLGIVLGIPAGAMVVSMIAVVVFNLFTDRAYFPRKLRMITQTATGALIGSRMSMNDILGLQDIIVPAVFLVVGMMVLTLVIGYTIYRFCKFDLATSLLASTPGGLSEISLMAEDLGADTPKVAVLHLFRLVTVISTFPAMLKYICVHFS